MRLDCVAEDRGGLDHPARIVVHAFTTRHRTLPKLPRRRYAESPRHLIWIEFPVGPERENDLCSCVSDEIILVHPRPGWSQRPLWDLP